MSYQLSALDRELLLRVFEPSPMARILVIDNYDSFTWNIVDALARLGARCEVVRSDTCADAADAFDGVVLGPGPCAPKDAGDSIRVALTCASPVLGICLGHQVIAEAFGGRTIRARRAVHGKAEPITHDGRGVFAGLPRSFADARDHSLAVEPETLPAELEVSARSADGEIMAMRHRTRPIESVQFHPESWLSEHGSALLSNWLGRAACS